MSTKIVITIKLTLKDSCDIIYYREIEIEPEALGYLKSAFDNELWDIERELRMIREMTLHGKI